MSHPTIAAISGSLRRASHNTALLREAARLTLSDVDVTIADLSRIPLYNGDDEKSLGYPEAVEELRRVVASADALLIATPEYNGSVPGVLKNALDWLSRGSDSPLRDKAAAVIGGGGRLGTAGAQRHLREILFASRVIVMPRQLLVPAVWAELDGEGRLMSDELADRLRRHVLELAEFARRLEIASV